MHRIPIVTVLAMGIALSACDRQQGAPPTYESPTLDVARSISGVQAEAPAAAASGSSSNRP